MKKLIRLTMAMGLAVGYLLSATAYAHQSGRVGAVFTATNDSAGNEIIMFSRDASGDLEWQNSFSTGGTGTSGGLGNQGGVILSNNKRWLLVVNAGSDDISVFRVKRHGLQLMDVEPSGGDRPVSLTMHGNLVYVVNAGSDTISGFTLSDRGDLEPIPGSMRDLSGAGVGAAQVSFNPTGDMVVVTEKATNLISVFPVDDQGVAGDAVINLSEGMTPFGFDFDKRGHLLVSEAAGGAPDASSVSSYSLHDNGMLDVISAAVPTTETAACWLLVSKDGSTAYTTNTGSQSLSAYSIARDGSITLDQADGVAAQTGPTSRPIDLALSNNGRFVYALSAADGTISGFSVAYNGKLMPVETEGGLPTGLNGLAAY